MTEPLHSFFIPCVPPKATHQAGLRIMRRKDGQQFIGRFANSAATSAKEHLVALLSRHALAAPLPGPLQVEIHWVYPWRASETKTNRSKGAIPCTTRPDNDNLQKLFMDCMTRCGFWADDSHVSDTIFRRRFGNKPGINITIHPIE